jgi:hypothetical protein
MAEMKGTIFFSDVMTEYSELWLGANGILSIRKTIERHMRPSISHLLPQVGNHAPLKSYRFTLRSRLSNRMEHATDQNQIENRQILDFGRFRR